MGHTWDKGPHRRGDPEAMLAYLRHQAQTDPVMAHAVAFIDHDRAELADYRASTAETLALHRRIHDDLRADVARMSNRCTFLEGALRRLLDGRTLTAEEESFARRLLDNRPGVDATGRQDQPEHPNAYVTTWRPAPAPDDVLALCGEVDRLRAENAALAAALSDIADGECLSMDDVCRMVHPDDPDEWCTTCVAEVAWAAWKIGRDIQPLCARCEHTRVEHSGGPCHQRSAAGVGCDCGQWAENALEVAACLDCGNGVANVVDPCPYCGDNGEAQRLLDDGGHR